jgi:hypothetical protein
LRENAIDGEQAIASPFELSRIHWVRRELVCEATHLTRTADGLSAIKGCAWISRRRMCGGKGLIPDDNQPDGAYPILKSIDQCGGAMLYVFLLLIVLVVAARLLGHQYFHKHPPFKMD